MTKKAEVEKIAKGVVSYLTKIKKGNMLPDLISELQKTADKENFKVSVISPYKLSESELKMAKKYVLSVIKEEKANFVFEVDPKLIDGMKFRVGDRVWDMTLFGKLEKVLK